MKPRSFSFRISGDCIFRPFWGRFLVLKLIAVVFMSAGLSPALHASGNWYVRSGALGLSNGMDWNNAWTDVTAIDWNKIVAGDAIWIAGGNYGILTIGKSGTSGSPIYIARVRSTNAVPVAASGWNPSFDSTVVMPRMNGYNHSYWTLDGQIPHGGIVLNNPSVSTGDGVYLGQSPVDYVTLQNLLITGSVTDQNVPGVGDNHAIFYNGIAYSGAHGLTIRYCTIQQYVTLILTVNMSNMVIEHCKLWKNYSGTTGNHPNIFAAMGGTNVIFRYNEITEYLAEGIMMDFVGANDPANDNWDIYGNLWHDSVAGWYGRVLESQYRPQTRIRFYNNTVVNVDHGILTGNGGSWGPGCESKNNIAWLATNATELEFGQGFDDYNLSKGTPAGVHSIAQASSAIFVDYAGGDYRIVSTVGARFPRDKGVDLGSVYNEDFAGNLRIGSWDIGAFEYPSNLSTVLPPTNLRIIKSP